MDTAVDWERIGRAVEAYKRWRYEYVEVPWTAPMDVLRATILLAAPGLKDPESYVSEASGVGPLVGSAEQSILAMRLDGRLGPGRYVACTPCFRPGEVVDATHAKTFMKVELWDDSVRGLDADAARYMNGELESSSLKVERVVTREGVDLEVNGVEVGSYGVRSAMGLTWSYGTGLAEPRFSAAMVARR